MRNIIFAAGLFISACTAAQVNTAIADGQLVCKVGPTLVAVSDPAGAAVLAKGASAPFVIEACALLNGTPAPLPPGAVALPATITPPALQVSL